MLKPIRVPASAWRIANASRSGTRTRSARASARTATGQPRSPVQRILAATTLALAIGLLGAVGAIGQGSLPVKVLVFHGSTTHESVDAAVDAITELGTDNDFQVDATANPADIAEANLADYRAVVALHSSGDAFDASQQSALQGFIQSGGGFLAIGEAAELEPGVTFFDNLIGARPATGSPTETTERIVEAGDRTHPATRDLPLEWGPRSDVWYEWAQNPTGQVHTVARVRLGQVADDGWRNGTTSLPIAWCRDFQGGRSFYTGIGRTTAGWQEANLRAHVLGAIQWTSGMVRAGCKATIASNYETVRLTNGANGLANAGEAHGVTVAPNGWVITTSRADCGSSEERGARVGLASLMRTLNFADPNVGVGCAPIHIWDPDEYDGSLNSGNTRAGTLTVYGDRGSGGEINGKIETGGLGITVAPDFTETGHIYVQYFPVFNQNPVHPGLSDGAQRRITKMGKGRISRFTIDLDTKELDLSSEVPIFEYDSQIYSCCHRGGGMGWDSEGNLYITTGDSNSSGGTGGYSGNNPPPECPTGDPTEASNAHCGDNPISYQDARRTAGSTNDYNGKMLRFNPVDEIADGERPEIGPGTTYTLPNQDSPNGPNLFSGAEGDGDQAKPEIYAMGLRNPSRLSIDPATDVPYTAWVGPDAGSPSVTQGPSTYEPAAQIPEAGNWGWPYCMGDQQAYRDRLANGSLRTTNEPGFVTGGPAGSPTQGWYDCDDLVNNSPRNTGLTVLPHSTGTGKDAGTARPANIWYSRGNQGQNNGCPSFPREHGADGAPNYGATPTALCPYYNNLGGWTIMNGPVYRHEPDPGNNSMRWPEYWDGRWFVHDFSGGNAKSFGFLLDPETAGDGGQPSYVDKMSQYINWSGGNYMDSKFGPDGALYLQTYDGNYFFHGINDGLHRVAYTGGPDTPNPDPQWQSLGGGEVEFSIGRSGGVAYEWDFGDGSEPSTEPNPVHAYGEPGDYEVTLTVTYADDEELSRTIDVVVSDDTTPPETTHELDPSDPGEGGTYDAPVDVTLSATDPDEGGGGGEPQTHDVDATGTTWTPDDLEIAFGDEVRWNFPTETAGFPHDVWLIVPGEAPDSDGTELTNGSVDPGGPSVSETFEESGTWTFVCKVHSFVNQGAWQGMVGTIDVGEDTGGGATASGVERTEYRVNTDGATGEWQTSTNDGEDDPFETTFTVSEEGDHQVQYRSRDRAGNVEETKSVEFSIAGDEPPPPGGECLPPSDEFVGDELDPKWDVLREAGVGPQVADGSLSLEIRQGDFIANDPLAENTVLQDAPDGEWTVTTRLDTSGINANGEQAGLVIWKSESPNTFSKIVAIQSNAGIHQFEHIVTQNGSVNPPIPQSITPAPGGQLPEQILLRARYTGTEVIGEFSDDNGQSWTRIGQEGHAAPFTAPLRIGLAAFRGSNGGGFADFDWFRVHAGSDAGGPIACVAECVTRTDEFDGTELDSQRWSFRHPSMPATGDGAPRVEGGNLVFPLGANSVDQGREGPIAFLGQPLPDGDFTVEAKINAPGLNADTGGMESDYAQVGLALYQTDDDWIAAYHTRNADDGGTAETYFEMKYETEGSRSIGPRVGQAPAVDNLPTFWIRIDRSGDTITAAYSLTDPDEGGEWVDLVETPNLADIFAPADGPVHIGAVGANGTIEATYEYIRFDPDDEECPPVDGCPQSDEFNASELDPKWEIVNPNAAGLSIGGGNLTLTTVQGDVFGGNFTAQNILLQPAPEGPWTATTKLDHSAINSNGQAAGLVIYGQENPNYFAKTATQYKNNDLSGNPMNGIWVERVLTTDGAVNPNYGGSGEFGPNPNFPNTGKLEPPTDDLWIRARFDGTDVHTEYSLDGSAFAPSAPPFPASVLGEEGVTKIGLFVKHDGGGPATDVDFDWFRVDAASCPADGDVTPPTTTHSLDPGSPDGSGGWYVSPVEVTLNATDNEGGSGVDFTEYRFAGDEDWTTYEGPFTVSDDGRHTIQYRSHDNAGNTENAKQVSFRIDSAAPETEALLNGEEPVSNYDGPVDVELLADDGDGSGVTATEIRVDGGDWQPYVTEETILNSEADLQRWAQAGPGGLEWIAPEGGISDSIVAIEASGDSPEQEGPENLFDGVAETKWLIFEATGFVEFELSEPVAATQYGLTSANDAPTRDPMDWTLSGSNDGETWTELDSRSGEDFPERFLAKTYEFENETAYSHFRLEVTANHGAGLIQLAELRLPEAEDGSAGSGFARTFGGLGMPWYPVKAYGDFSLKMQWRDSSIGAVGNSGVFVRFPHPEGAVALPPAERYPCQVGSAQSQPAWVAIYCGHEVQINDHQDSEPQKTGSIYNFSPLDAEEAQVQPKGTWVDYEVRVVGQTYTIIRNGDVLQEWENAPDQNSSRPGDPPTNDRQFASGYIGLQNHGGSDVIDFRNVRVLPLDEGSVEGPITISGEGEHTVEFRSTDVAGNEEETKVVNFTIGDADDTTPPVTTHMLVPQAPGDGGTYDRRVGLMFFASDGEDGSGVDYTEYRVNGGEWITYDAFMPPEFDADGDYLIEYRSVDNAGNVEEPPGSVSFTIDTAEVGEPRLRVVGQPKLRRVGPRKKQTGFRLRASNIGTAPTGPVRLCARAPQKRVAIRGQRCVSRPSIPVGATRQRQVRLRIKPAARGKVTPVRLIANGPNVDRALTTVRLRVRK